MSKEDDPKSAFSDWLVLAGSDTFGRPSGESSHAHSPKLLENPDYVRSLRNSLTNIYETIKLFKDGREIPPFGEWLQDFIHYTTERHMEELKQTGKSGWEHGLSALLAIQRDYQANPLGIPYQRN